METTLIIPKSEEKLIAKAVKKMSQKFLFKKYMDLSTPELYKKAFRSELSRRGVKLI